ncbi:hypothetical protein H072_10566 [Dactylellina haptotyla CBS 200.50]|uniref:Uncharacterized protein n=1 Tax=Dactylellina haptotyla (strain CBS 200.50) TaxID=1284197 RepID=S8A490_DACHA|nr:hypothetical protein H072_10566 [Dactylellina haptotyla CBS 200.50]
MHSKVIVTSLFLAIAPSVLAAPYYQPMTTTTACAKPTPTTTTTKCKTSTTTTKKCTKSSTTTFVQPYYVPVSSSSVQQYVIPTTSSLAPYVVPTTSTPLAYGVPTTSSIDDAYVVETTPTPTPSPVIITSVTRITEMATPLPTTVTVIPLPPPPPPKTLHCSQQWYGTAPFCNGKCPSNWNVVRYQRAAAKTCDSSTPDKIIDRCDNTSKHGCSAGFHKVLCEWCEMK